MWSAGISIAATLIMSVAAIWPASAQPSVAGDIPQSIRIEHNDTIQQLTRLSHKRGPVGVEAAKVSIGVQKGPPIGVQKGPLSRRCRNDISAER
jgi:hypothetical protein